MTNIPGVDYAWQHPGGAALAAAGKKFAARYLSSDASKNLSRAEADDLAAHGVASVVVWETTAKRPLAGRAAGIVDAQTAQRQATAAGMPGSRPVYLAVDFDATASQMAGPVGAYFDGAASVLGLARVGGYGGYNTIRYLLDHGLIRWAWQTRAWSAGRWDGRAHIRQGSTQTIGGVSCDLNTALAADYGQWTPGRTPIQEDDMTPDQARQLAELHAMVRFKGWDYQNADEVAAAAKTHTRAPDAWGKVSRTDANVLALRAELAAMRAAMATLAAHPNATPEQIQAASKAGAAEAIAEGIVRVEVTGLNAGSPAADTTTTGA